MFRFRVGPARHPQAARRSQCPSADGPPPRRVLQVAALLWLVVPQATFAVVLWSDLGATLVHETGAGTDLLGGAVRRDDSASDTLYFKFHVDPLSDVGTEEYFAAFQMVEGDADRLGIGNSQKAWAYSAFNTADTGEFNRVFGDMDLRSARGESSGPELRFPYELPRRGIEVTIVFRVQYVPGGDDLVTVWLNPDLAAGATESRQPENLTTRFHANASFTGIRLRHAGGGGGWTFSDMAIATSFEDFVGPFGGVSGSGRGSLPLTLRSWQRDQGLPHNSVRALAQTRDGYLWLGSDDGITRFDGVRFTSFGAREGLHSGRVTVLFEDRCGTLWIGTAGAGLIGYTGGKFKTYNLAAGLPSDSITAAAEDEQGRLWIGTEAGVAIMSGDSFRALDEGVVVKGKPVSVLYRDHHGTMWLGSPGVGLFRQEQGKFVAFTDPSVGSLLQTPHCLLEDKSGRLWVGAGDDFVLCREGSEWRRYRLPRHLAKPYVATLAEEPDGTVWAGSVSEGIFQFKAGTLAVFKAADGLTDNFVESLLVDREGNIWVGTGGGLNRLRRRNLSVLAQAEGLGYGVVQGLAELGDDLVWAGKPADGMYRFDGRSFSRVGAELFRSYPEVFALLRTRDGACWAAVTDALLEFTKPASPVPQPAPPVLTGFRTTALLEDSAGDLWAGTREGVLWARRNGEWQRQTSYAAAHSITALAETANHTLWIGTEGGGLHVLNSRGTAHYGKSSGLLSDLIRTLYVDRDDTVWIGTAGGGLSRWCGDRLSVFTVREGLPDNTVSQILEDNTRRLWLGTSRGIACVGKRDLEELAEGRIQAVYPQVYGRSEGMPSEECTAGFYPAGLKTASGRLWFPTLKGIVVIDPRPPAADLPAPAVVLEQVVVDGAVAETSAAASPAGPSSAGVPGPASSTGGPGGQKSSDSRLLIGPGKKRFEFHYTGLSFSAPERVRFRYRLQGLDTDWVDAGTRRAAFYGYVPPGEYRFQVTACNSAGIWNETGASLALSVQPFFYQTWTFKGVAILGLLLGVGAVVRLVEKRRHQQRVRLLEQERALERERARIAQDLHDDLGASLTRVNLLSDLVKADKDNPSQVELHAQKISESAGQTVRALDEIVWALRPGSDSLQSLVDYIAHFANEMFEGQAIRCRLDLPPDPPPLSLAPEVRHNIFLIVKEALTNALKHSGAKEVHVQARATTTSLEIQVQDDGQGYDSPPMAAPGRQNGLRNMRNRAESIGATIELQSLPGKGTGVRLKLNLRKR